MGRPRKRRRIGFLPTSTVFKPQAIPVSELEHINLSIDELESIRLTALESLTQSQAATRMDVHQSTLQRILVRANRKIADALINNKAIEIEQAEKTRSY